MNVIYYWVGFFIFWSAIGAAATYFLKYINYNILGGQRKSFLFYIWEVLYMPFGLYKAYQKYNGWPLFLHYRNIRHGLEWYKIDGWRSTWSWWFLVWLNSFFATRDYGDAGDLRRSKLKKITKDQFE